MRHPHSTWWPQTGLAMEGTAKWAGAREEGTHRHQPHTTGQLPLDALGTRFLESESISQRNE